MENDDVQPLLEESSDVSSSKFTKQRSKLLPWNSRNSNKNELQHLLDYSDVFHNIVEEEETEQNFISAVFVVAFDTHSGNKIEWFLPDDIDLDSLEFKAMPSGAHTITADFIYFRIKNMFGLSCYEKLPVESKEERGARMKSVGIIAYSYTTLHRHMQFLENQVRRQLQTPGKYEQLIEFYNDYKGVLPSLTEQPSAHFSAVSRNFQSELPQMKITHPAGCFKQFIRFFGQKVFVLWKLMLLRKRILFFSPPPVGVVCYRVYCACCLGKITTNAVKEKSIIPYFYVNIADIDQLESEMTFVACTTEKIFQDKTHLYDIYVDNQVITTTNEHLKEFLKVSKVDKQNYQNLLNLRNDFLHQQESGSNELPDEEQLYQWFFTRMNNQLFQVLHDAASSSERTLTSDHLTAMGLDPSVDSHFVMDLLELYGIDLILVVDNPCCPI